MGRSPTKGKVNVLTAIRKMVANFASLVREEAPPSIPGTNSGGDTTPKSGGGDILQVILLY